MRTAVLPPKQLPALSRQLVTGRHGLGLPLAVNNVFFHGLATWSRPSRSGAEYDEAVKI